MGSEMCIRDSFSGSPDVVLFSSVRLKSRWVEGGGCNCGTSEVAGGGGCERFKLRLVGGGMIEDGSNFLFGVMLSVDCLFFLLCELWIEGLVLPFFLNSDNGGTIEVAGY